MNRIRLISVFFALALVLVVVQTAAACPSCKAALAAGGDTDQANLVRGFFWSILFMLSMPFTLLGTFSFVMYRAVKRARAAEAANQLAQPVAVPIASATPVPATA